MREGLKTRGCCGRRLAGRDEGTPYFTVDNLSPSDFPGGLWSATVVTSAATAIVRKI